MGFWLVAFLREWVFAVSFAPWMAAEEAFEAEPEAFEEAVFFKGLDGVG